MRNNSTGIQVLLQHFDALWEPIRGDFRGIHFSLAKHFFLNMGNKKAEVKENDLQVPL